MKTKELIEVLQAMDPEAFVYVYHDRESEFVDRVAVVSTSILQDEFHLQPKRRMPLLREAEGDEKYIVLIEI